MRRMTRLYRVALLIPLGLFIACATAQPPASVPPPPLPPAPPPHVEAPKKTVANIVGASWYGPGFVGHRTADGERFSPKNLTAASKDLPLGSRVLVTNLKNGRSVKVRINDCGPMRNGRKLDLSQKAARRLGMIHDGIIKVRIRIVETPSGAVRCDL